MTRSLLAVLLLSSVISWGRSADAAEPFAFQKDDVVAIFGNGLADRMQHDPWVETVLQHQTRGLNVRFRNMSFSGDMRGAGILGGEAEILCHDVQVPSCLRISMRHDRQRGRLRSGDVQNITMGTMSGMGVV